MTRPDPRLTPARADLAAAHLRGRVEAARYVVGDAACVIAEALDLRQGPGPDKGLLTQALYGERLVVYEDEEGWAYVQLDGDGYVGYLPAAGLLPQRAAPTHKLCVPRSFVYPGASIKHPVMQALPLGATVAVHSFTGEFARLQEGGFVYARHLVALEAVAADWVAVAEAFLNAPYLWGGKTWCGIDCSGLVQVALQAGGISAPRDSDMLQAFAGEDVSALARTRGDLVFWRGHVGIMRDAETLLHANGYFMQVTSEPLAQATARIEATGGGNVTGLRRIAPARAR
ncbi:MAG: C40 family peptidase [Hyphomicrobiales bacterium]|nr:C40 family peptidase [Hyphomicrobiales bacterium]